MSAKPSHNLAGLQVAHPRATSPAVCLLKELGFHVDNKRLSLISLAALKLPTRGWGVSGEPDPLSAGGSQRETLCNAPVGMTPFPCSAFCLGLWPKAAEHFQLLQGIGILLVCPGISWLGSVFHLCAQSMRLLLWRRATARSEEQSPKCWPHVVKVKPDLDSARPK